MGTEDSENANFGEAANGALSTITDAAGDLVTGIPAPLRKNALKAFTRLCTAAVEYPLALIEGAVAEKRAETRARVKLIDASATQIAEQMRTSPDYARAAATKFAQKIVRERVNVDQVADFALADLRAEQAATQSQPEAEADLISDDWLNAFDTEASQMSSEQMQRLFGRILAGEIRRPKSYSIKTIKLMAQLDNQAATLFQLLCSLSVSLRVPGSGLIADARVVSLGNPGNNSLKAYGLSFSALNVLQEYGLIVAEYNTKLDYQAAVAHEGKVVLCLVYENEQLALLPKTPTPTKPGIVLTGVMFSQAGRELLSVVEVEPNPAYRAALTAHLDENGFTLGPVRVT